MEHAKNSNEPRTPTQAQIDANRENAKKSTGPRTAAGKAASSRNRLLHGLRANKHILLDEDPEEFLILLRDLYDRFQPSGETEEMLVMRIASAHWRLDRAFPMEAGLYRNRLREIAEEDAESQRTYAWQKESAEVQGAPVPPAPAPNDERDRLARAFDADCVAPNSLARLARYEGSIERSIDRCLRQLKTYQAARTASTARAAQPLNPESPGVGHAVPPAQSAETPVETPAAPAATPSNSVNYHSNPKNEGIAQFGLALYAMLSAFLHSLPEPIAAIAALLTGQTGHNRSWAPRPSRQPWWSAPRMPTTASALLSAPLPTLRSYAWPLCR
jgi:hypothetical protein